MNSEDFLKERGWKQIDLDYFKDEPQLKDLWCKENSQECYIMQEAVNHELEQIPHSMFEMLQQFHKVFGLEYNAKPIIPDYETIKLRISLICEEHQEVLEEIAEGETSGEYLPKKDINLEKLAKELADLMYVTLGTAVSFGINMDNVFAEVHRSNMSKLTKDGEVLRRSDGKVLKSDQYTPANLKDIINGS